MSIVGCLDLLDVGALGPLTVQNPLETTAPTILSIEIGTVDDSTFVLTAIEAVTASDFALGWTLTADATELTISGSLQISPTVFHLTITEDVYTGQTVLASYSAAVGDITDVSGMPNLNALADITNQAVTNNSTTEGEVEPTVEWSRAYSRGWLNQTATTVSRATLSGWVQQA